MIITSQRYLNEEIVAEKKEELKGLEQIELPVTSGIIDDESYSLLRDGHHRYAAAKELGIEIIFKETIFNDDNQDRINDDFESFILLHHMGDDFFNLETGENVW